MQEMKVSESYLVFQAPGESYTISITCNTNWSITYYPSWITLDKTSGISNDTILIEASENPESDIRTGIIKINGTGIQQELTINLIQHTEKQEKAQYIGVNIGESGGQVDFSADKAWADAMKTHREYQWNIPINSWNWPEQDSFTVTLDEIGINNNYGEFKLHFNCDNKENVEVTSSYGTLTGKTTNSWSNTVTYDLNIEEPGSVPVELTFTNAGTGVYDVKLSDIPLDQKGWPIVDTCAGVIYHGLNTKNNHGTYKLRFDCNNPDGVNIYLQWTDYSISDKTIDGNRVSYDIIIPDPDSHAMRIVFNNTDGGIRNATLMRPLEPGGQETYPEGTLFTNQFLKALEPFSVLRAMKWMAGDSPLAHKNWSDRTPWDYATMNTKDMEGGARGPAWESILILANMAQKDLWITLPVRATDLYIEELANFFKNGNEYTRGLDPDLKLYIELGNEIWNCGDYPGQMQFMIDDAYNYIEELNFDNQVNDDYLNLLFRYQGMRTVQISNIFRRIFGNDQMHTRIRPYIGHHQAYHDIINRTLSFIDKYYGCKDPESPWTDPHPVNYYIYGFGCTSYYSPAGNIPGVTIENIWDDIGFQPEHFKELISIDAYFASTYGLKYITYEGGQHPKYPTYNDDGSIDEAGNYIITRKCATHPKMYDLTKIMHSAFNETGGELSCYFKLTQTKVDDVEDENIERSLGQFGMLIGDLGDLTQPGYKAMAELAYTERTETIDIGYTAPFIVTGRECHIIGTRPYDGEIKPEPGIINLTMDKVYFSSYCFHTDIPGSYNAYVDYTNASSDAKIQLELNGNLLGTYDISGNGTVQAINFPCDTNVLYSIRIICTTGSVTIDSVSITDQVIPQYRTAYNTMNYVTSPYTEEQTAGIITTVIQNTDEAWTVTGGLQAYDIVPEGLPEASGGTVITIWISSHSAEITFAGHRVRIIGTKHSWGASADVKIDGVTAGTPDWYADTPISTVIFESEILEEGLHTLLIDNPGDWVNIDYIEVDSEELTGPVPVSGISIDQQDITLLTGQSHQLTASISPYNATDKTVSWSSGNNNIAAIDQNGLISAVSPGTCTITAAAVNMSFTDSITINIIEQGELETRESIDTYFFGHSLTGDIAGFLKQIADENSMECSAYPLTVGGAPLQFWIEDGLHITQEALSYSSDSTIFIITDSNYELGNYEYGVWTEKLSQTDPVEWWHNKTKLDALIEFVNMIRTVHPQAPIYFYSHWHDLLGSGEEQYMESIIVDGQKVIYKDEYDMEHVCEVTDNPGENQISYETWNTIFNRHVSTTSNEFLEYFEELIDLANQSPDLIGPDIKLIPAGSLLFNIFKLPEFDEYDTSTLFKDVVHVKPEAFYFLGLIHYMALYGKRPVELQNIPPEYTVEQVNAAAEYIWNELNDYSRL